MRQGLVHQQFHGYRNGHQLLSSSVTLESSDQDTVNKLSDLSGHLHPGQNFDPYLTAYPLPSGQFYVVAKTFQDLTAPRSGCVLTRSLFVPMQIWESQKTVKWLLDELVPIEEGEVAQTSDVFIGPTSSVQMCDEPRLVELVQALFFENALPVVVFDPTESELITSRLLEALWPALKRRFSICTMALSPRQLGGHDFDLMFAPVSARSRFGGSRYRRLSTKGSRIESSVYGWSHATSNEIFCSDEPNLVPKNMLRVFEDKDIADRNAVRIVLLWRDLQVRAEESPSAVLGMLDVVNSLGGPERMVTSMVRILIKSMVFSRERFSDSDAWDFVLVMDAKMDWDTAPKILAVEMENTAQALSARTPRYTLEAISSLEREEISMPLAQGLGKGLSLSMEFDKLATSLLRLAPRTLLRMIDSSDALVDKIGRTLNGYPDTWLTTIEHALRGQDPSARAKLRKRIVPLVAKNNVERAIPRILSGASDVELGNLVVALNLEHQCDSEILNRTLSQVVRDTGSIDLVRDMVLSAGIPDDSCERFLVCLLTFSETDLKWLLALENDGLRDGILTSLLAATKDSTIRRTLSSGTLLNETLAVLGAAMPNSIEQLLHILQLEIAEGEIALNIGFEVTEVKPSVTRSSFGKWMLKKALVFAAPRDKRVSSLFRDFSSKSNPSELVETATDSSASALRVAENLALINSANPEVRDAIVPLIDSLSRQLVSREREVLDESAYFAWAEILNDAIVRKVPSCVSSASIVFGFALQHVSYPVSKLVVTAFPTVYSEIMTLKDLAESSKDIQSLKERFSFRWNSPKEGRRELLQVLIDAFVSSSWPPADLLITALDVRIGRKVVKRIRKRPFGEKYIDRVKEDMDRLDEKSRRRISRCLSRSS